jgi:hypothetical protein
MARGEVWNPELRGAEYKPALTVRSFGSRGKSSRINGHTTGRVHHLLSTTELSAFYLYDWIPEIRDIREQYALDLDETQAIADDLGMCHIADRSTGTPFVVTSDFVLTRECGSGAEVELVRSCKQSADLSRISVLKKLEIERRYWRNRGVEWRLVTERDLPSALIRNLEWIHPYYRPASVPVSANHIEHLTVNLHARLCARPSESLVSICTDLDKHVGLEAGTHLSLVRHALARRHWTVDLQIEIKPSQPLIFRGADTEPVESQQC